MSLWAQIVEPFHFDRLQQMAILNGAVGRLLLACLLGAMVGIERESKRKAAGVRTNLLICMGAAFFTLLSAVLSGDGNPNKGQVASNIVQGIGFLGAGLILHNRNRISGLTSAASVWVVASIGMACGAGLYGAAIAAAMIVILALELVGVLESRANLKTYSLIYEARGRDQRLMQASILDAMDKIGEHLRSMDADAYGETQRVNFSIITTGKRHYQLRGALQSEPAIEKLLVFRDPEDD